MRCFAVVVFATLASCDSPKPPAAAPFPEEKIREIVRSEMARIEQGRPKVEPIIVQAPEKPLPTTKPPMTEAERKNRIALFTIEEEKYWNASKGLASNSLARISVIHLPGLRAFIVGNADLYGEDLVRRRLIEFADDRGIDRIIAAQNITGQMAVERAKLAFAVLEDAQQQFALTIATAESPDKLTDTFKRLVRDNPDLFPRFTK